MSYRRILIPLDGSRLSEQAIDAALPLAEAFSSEILLVGVLDLTTGIYDAYAESIQIVDMREQLQSFLKDALDRGAARLRAKDVETRRLLETGVPHEEIVRIAEREKADLVVMTTHGRKGLSHMLLGSVAEKVIRLAPCPVLVIRPKDEEEKAS